MELFLNWLTGENTSRSTLFARLVERDIGLLSVTRSRWFDTKRRRLDLKGQQKELLTWAHEVDRNWNTDTVSRQLSRCTLASIRNSCKTIRWWLEITSHRLRSQSINFKDRDLKFSMESIWFHHRNIGSFHQILIIMQVFMTLQTRCILTTNLSAVSSKYVSLDCVWS